MMRQKKINEKNIISLSRMNAFRNDMDLLNSLDLLQSKNYFHKAK